MAIAEDASTPVVVRSAERTTNAGLTTASFSPPANSLLVAIFTIEHQSIAAAQPTSVSDTAGGTWFIGRHIDGGGTSKYGNGTIWYRFVSTAPGSITVTASRTGGASANLQLGVRVVTGAHTTSQPGGASSQHVTTTNGTQFSITTTEADSRVYVLAGLGRDRVMTPNGSTTSIDVWNGPVNAAVNMIGRATNLTTTPGATTLGWTGTTSGDECMFAAVEILTAPAAPLIQDEGSKNSSAMSLMRG